MMPQDQTLVNSNFLLSKKQGLRCLGVGCDDFVPMGAGKFFLKKCFDIMHTGVARERYFLGTKSAPNAQPGLNSGGYVQPVGQLRFCAG